MNASEVRRDGFILGEGLHEGEGAFSRRDESLVIFNPKMRTDLVMLCCGMGGGVSVVGGGGIADGGMGGAVLSLTIALFSTSSTTMDRVFQEMLVIVGCPWIVTLVEKAI